MSSSLAATGAVTGAETRPKVAVGQMCATDDVEANFRTCEKLATLASESMCTNARREGAFARAVSSRASSPTTARQDRPTLWRRATARAGRLRASKDAKTRASDA